MDFNYKIEKKLGTLSENGVFAKEVNIISYNGRDGKIDIRNWNTVEQKMGKGITLSAEEAQKLVEILNKEC